METLGTRIKSIRNEYNLSQKAFADKLYVTASYISKVEKDVEKPSDIFIKLLSYEFNNNFEWIKTGEFKKMEIGIVSRENALEYYDFKIKELNYNTLLLNAEDIFIITDIIDNILNLVDVFLLNKENSKVFYNSLKEFISLTSTLVTYIKYNGEKIRKDYHKLLLFKTDFDKVIVKINESLKEMIRYYINEYDIDIEL